LRDWAEAIGHDTAILEASQGGNSDPAGRFAIPVSLRLAAKTGIVERLDAPIGLAFETDHTIPESWSQGEP
jgi:hypothetical protein